MTYVELKNLIANKIKEYPQYKDRAIQELRRAKWADEDGINIADIILNSDKPCDNRYVIPFFLGKTTEVDLTKPLETIQVKEGGSGGLDIDLDFQPSGKEANKQWLLEKFGKDRALSVGTYGTVGLSTAARDILRKAECPYTESNSFCKELNDEISFEENMKEYKKNKPILYKTYERYKPWLEMTDKIVGQVSHVGQHAGGLVLLDKPIWMYGPVVHTKDGIATAFEESGSAQYLDECGICKIDCLSIAVLETISNAVDMIDKKLIKIIDDDGIEKIVTEDYIEHKE